MKKKETHQPTQETLFWSCSLWLLQWHFRLRWILPVEFGNKMRVIKKQEKQYMLWTKKLTMFSSSSTLWLFPIPSSSFSHSHTSFLSIWRYGQPVFPCVWVTDQPFLQSLQRPLSVYAMSLSLPLGPLPLDFWFLCSTCS